jgi:hypothetical protein
MAQYRPPLYDCPDRPPIWLLQKARCNGAPDCLGGDEIGQGWARVICNALGFVALDRRRTVEIWSRDGKKKYTTVTYGWRRTPMLQQCEELFGAKKNEPGANADPNAFTIDVPGITDIIKAPEFTSKSLKQERYERMQTKNSPVPKPLQWIPPILTKLDNAQDLLFTGLALLYPLLKFAPKALLGPVGILLTINDVLNLLT